MQLGDVIIIYVPSNCLLNWMSLFVGDNFVQLNHYTFVVAHYLGKYLVQKILIKMLPIYLLLFLEKR
jgi:hypothetical protein